MAYYYAPDRKAEQPIRHLQGFVGTLQFDGYAVCKVLAERNAVSLAFCWSRVRRKFYELANSLPRARPRHGVRTWAKTPGYRPPHPECGRA